MPARSDIVRISHLHTYNTFGRINIAPRTCIVWWVYGTYWVLERNSIPYTMYGCSLFNVSWQWCSCLCIVNYYDYANDFAMLLNFENDWLLWECFQSIKHMPDWSGFLANFYLLGFKKFLGGFFFQYTFRSSLIFFFWSQLSREAWLEPHGWRNVDEFYRMTMGLQAHQTGCFKSCTYINHWVN